jgi:hypothetical protein
MNLLFGPRTNEILRGNQRADNVAKRNRKVVLDYFISDPFLPRWVPTNPTNSVVLLGPIFKKIKSQRYELRKLDWLHHTDRSKRWFTLPNSDLGHIINNPDSKFKDLFQRFTSKSLPTKKRIASTTKDPIRKTTVYDSQLCHFCQVEDSHEHIFAECSLAKTINKWVKDRLAEKMPGVVVPLLRSLNATGDYDLSSDGGLLTNEVIQFITANTTKDNRRPMINMASDLIAKGFTLKWSVKLLAMHGRALSQDEIFNLESIKSVMFPDK